MSVFLGQFAGTLLLFCLIEGLDEFFRRLLPGRRGRVYHLAKLGYGLPLVLAAAATVERVSLPAVALGCLVAGTALLLFFGPSARAGETTGGTR